MRRPLDRWLLSITLLCLACQAAPEQVAAPPLPRSIDPVVSIARLTSGVSALGHPYRWYAEVIAPVVDERLRTLPGSFVEMIVLLRVDGESSYGDRGVWNPSAQRTVIGRFHLSLLTFVECSQKLDGLRFITDELWVDEAAQRVYVLSDGALLSFPLPALSKPR